MTHPPSKARRRPRAGAICWPSRSPRSASSTATSAPARSTRCASAFTARTRVAADAGERARRAVADLLVARSSSSRSSTWSFVMRADNRGEGGILALTGARHAGAGRDARAPARGADRCSACSARRCSTATA